MLFFSPFSFGKQKFITRNCQGLKYLVRISLKNFIQNYHIDLSTWMLGGRMQSYYIINSVSLKIKIQCHVSTIAEIFTIIYSGKCILKTTVIYSRLYRKHQVCVVWVLRYMFFLPNITAPCTWGTTSKAEIVCVPKGNIYMKALQGWR